MAQQPQTPNFGSFGTAGQAATPPYAPPRMNVPPANPQIPPAPPSNGIQWGKVINGVAKVTAVVVVAAVAAVALYSLAGAVFGVPAVNTTLATGVHYLGVALEWAAGIAGTIYHTAAGFIGQALTSMGFGTMSFATGSGASAAASVAATAAGATAVAAGVPLAVSTVNDLSAKHALLATKTGAAHAALDPHMSHTLNDMAHHAGEHSNGHKSFAERLTPNKAAFTSHAEAVRASRPEASSSPNPRSASFAEQLNTDRANLENSLGTKIT